MKFLAFSLSCAVIYFAFKSVGWLIEQHEKKEQEKHTKPEILGH